MKLNTSAGRIAHLRKQLANAKKWKQTARVANITRAIEMIEDEKAKVQKSRMHKRVAKGARTPEEILGIKGRKATERDVVNAVAAILKNFK